jgi:hypothetical protein
MARKIVWWVVLLHALSAAPTEALWPFVLLIVVLEWTTDKRR